MVNVSDPANVAKVPVVGKVTLVLAVTVNVVVNAPEVVNDPPKVMVFEPLLTPVPPYVPVIIVPFQTPVAIVPTDVKLDKVVTAVFTNVPLVGNVTAVVPVTVNVVPKLPEMVIVLAALLATPVPPLTGDKTPVKLVIVLDEILTKSPDTEFQ